MGKASAFGILLDKVLRDPSLLKKTSKDESLRDKLREDAEFEAFLREMLGKFFEDGVFKLKLSCPECKKEIETDKINFGIFFFDDPIPDLECPQCGKAIKPASALGDIGEMREHFPIFFLASFFKLYGEMLKDGLVEELPGIEKMIKLSEELLELT